MKAKSSRNSSKALNRAGKADRLHFTIEELQSWYEYPLRHAALELGVCEAVLKRICRRNGIPKWPYRQVKTIDRYMSKVKESLRLAAETYGALLSSRATREHLVSAKQSQMKYEYFVSTLKQHRKILLRHAHDQATMESLEQEWAEFSVCLKQDESVVKTVTTTAASAAVSPALLQEQLDVVDAADQLLKLVESPILTNASSFHYPEATAGMIALSLSPQNPEAKKTTARGYKTKPPFMYN